MLFLSASCFAVACAAGAAVCFAAIRACAFAVVNGVAASFATRQFFSAFFFHKIASAKKGSFEERIKVSEQPRFGMNSRLTIGPQK